MSKNAMEQLKSCGIFPRKRLGQNFLTDKGVASRIAGSAGLSEWDTVVEIGPGLGILTEELIKSGAETVVIELDDRLPAFLKTRFKDAGNLEIIRGDALKTSYASIAARKGAPLKMVANLPYNISAPVLFKIFEERDIFTTLVLMFQREVADRITASPGTKDYGVTSVLSQLLAKVSVELYIPPTAFYPPPKVHSAVVKFDILKRPSHEVSDPCLFKRVVKAAFGMRRKTIRNALKTLGVSSGMIRDALTDSGIDPGTRGETLTVADYARLSNRLVVKDAKAISPITTVGS